jgi:hypothetical protein
LKLKNRREFNKKSQNTKYMKSLSTIMQKQDWKLFRMMMKFKIISLRIIKDTIGRKNSLNKSKFLNKNAVGLC